MKNIHKTTASLDNCDPERVARLTNKIKDCIIEEMDRGLSGLEVALSVVSFVAMSANSDIEIDALASRAKEMRVLKDTMRMKMPLDYSKTLQ